MDKDNNAYELIKSKSRMQDVACLSNILSNIGCDSGENIKLQEPIHLHAARINMILVSVAEEVTAIDTDRV